MLSVDPWEMMPLRQCQNLRHLSNQRQRDLRIDCPHSKKRFDVEGGHRILLMLAKPAQEFHESLRHIRASGCRFDFHVDPRGCGRDQFQYIDEPGNSLSGVCRRKIRPRVQPG